jgi:hypothetical protein
MRAAPAISDVNHRPEFLLLLMHPCVLSSRYGT